MKHCSFHDSSPTVPVLGSSPVRVLHKVQWVKNPFHRPKSSSTSPANKIQIYFFSFSSRKLHKNYQMSDQINSHICLMLSVYKNFHQTVKYGLQRIIYYQI